MSQHKLQISELDFDKIKANLKTFLQSQTQFQDYDFDILLICQLMKCFWIVLILEIILYH